MLPHLRGVFCLLTCRRGRGHRTVDCRLLQVIAGLARTCQAGGEIRLFASLEY